MSGNSRFAEAMAVESLSEPGLVTLSARYAQLNRQGERPDKVQVRTGIL